MEPLKIIVVCGATASGKSTYAVRLAQKCSGEVVNADAMQLYSGLNIGTAKITPEEREGVPHHLLDVAPIGEAVDVFRYCRLAQEAVSDIVSRRKTPILCGGTGYYIKAFLYGLDELPGDPDLRAQLEREFSTPESESLLRELTARDAPEDLERFGYHVRKLIRAREVFLLTGKPMVGQFTSVRAPRFMPETFHIVRERTELRGRIASRTAQMIANGWLEETRLAVKAGLLDSPTARQAIGYTILNEVLEDRLTLPEAEERIVTRTWQYARRQLTWFNRQPPQGHIVNL